MRAGLSGHRMFVSSAALIVSGAEMIKILDDKRPFIEQIS